MIELKIIYHFLCLFFFLATLTVAVDAAPDLKVLTVSVPAVPPWVLEWICFFLFHSFLSCFGSHLSGLGNCPGLDLSKFLGYRILFFFFFYIFLVCTSIFFDRPMFFSKFSISFISAIPSYCKESMNLDPCSNCPFSMHRRAS